MSDEAPGASSFAFPNPKGHAELPDQPELYGQADTRVRDAWADVLGRYPAHCFATLTFRQQRFYRDKRTGKVLASDRTGNNGSVHPEAADKAFRVFLSKINGDIYGRSWSKKWHGGCQWIRGSEFHKDGRLHFHALISAPTDDLWRLTHLRQHHRWWLDEFGFNRLERPRSQRDVQDYVADYVVKDGLLDFSRNFGAWVAPRLDYSAAPQQSTWSEGAHSNPTPATEEPSGWDGKTMGSREALTHS